MKHTLSLIAALSLASGACRAADAAPELPSPLDLRSAIGYALEHNFSIRQARETIRQQEGAVVQVRSQQIPNVTGTGLYQGNASAISQTYPAETSYWTVEVKATQTLFAGGGVVAAIKNAKLARDAAALDLQTAIDTALLDVRTKFYSALLDRDKIAVEEDNVRLYQHQLDDTKNQFDAGTVSNFEVLRAKVYLANAQPNLITARNSYRIAIEQLRQSLGVPAGEPFPALVGDLSFAPQSFDADTALAAAHEHRPELRKYDKLTEASEQSVKVARAGHYPSVQAFGAYEWSGFNFANSAFGSPTSNGWLAGVQSTWAIFDGRSTDGKILQAKSQLEQARLQKASEELEVDVEVRQALSSLQEAGELVNASRSTIEQAAEALRLAETKYHAGSATQLDQLTSEVSLTQAKTDQLTANYNYLVALANVRKAIGLSDALVTP